MGLSTPDSSRDMNRRGDSHSDVLFRLKERLLGPALLLGVVAASVGVAAYAGKGATGTYNPLMQMRTYAEWRAQDAERQRQFTRILDAAARSDSDPVLSLEEELEAFEAMGLTPVLVRPDLTDRAIERGIAAYHIRE